MIDPWLLVGDVWFLLFTSFVLWNAKKAKHKIVFWAVIVNIFLYFFGVYGYALYPIYALLLFYGIRKIVINLRKPKKTN